MRQFNQAYAEKLIAFYQSDLWTIIKDRLRIYTKELEKRSLKQIVTNNITSGIRYASMAEGVNEAIRVAEFLSSELMEEKFDADGVLPVIENKVTPKKEKEKKTWLSRLLVLHKNNRHKKLQ